MELVHECVPNKIVHIRPNDKPWYDSTIRSYTRKRDRLKWKGVRTTRTEDWRKYENMCNKVNNLNLKKYANERFFNNIENTLIETSNLNPKAYWQLLRHFIKTNKKLYPH